MAALKISMWILVTFLLFTKEFVRAKEFVRGREFVIGGNEAEKINFTVGDSLNNIRILPVCDKKEILFGGNGTFWTIPPSTDSLNEWAVKIKFIEGDTLTFKYNAMTDSVRNMWKAMEEYKDDRTAKTKLIYGSTYFISEKGQKVKFYIYLVDNSCYLMLRPKNGSVEL